MTTNYMMHAGLFAGLVFVCACAGGTPTGDAFAKADAPRSVSVDLDAPASVRTGAVLSVTITLTNISADPILLELAGKPELTYFTTVIMRPNGDTVLTVPNASVHLRIAHNLRLAPQQQFEIAARLTLPGATQRVLPPGEYRIRAEVLGRDRIFTRTKSLIVSP